MKQIKQNILEFMQINETSEYTSNQFVYKYIYYNHVKKFADYDFNFFQEFLDGPSVETILRCRRFIIKVHGIGIRVKVDKEIEYIKEYAIDDRYKN